MMTVILVAFIGAVAGGCLLGLCGAPLWALVAYECLWGMVTGSWMGRRK
jgi:hypothetical protein